MLNFIKIMHLLGQGNGYILMQNNLKNINFKKNQIFVKEEPKPKTGFTEKPSSKLMNIKCSDPFAPQKKV